MRVALSFIGVIAIPLGGRAQEPALSFSLVVQMSHAGYVSKMLLDPPNRQLATVSNSGEIKIWDLVRRQEVWTFKHKLGIATIGFGAIAFNREGSELASADDNGVIHLINLKTGASTEINVPESSISAFAFSASGDRLAIGGFGGRVDVVDLIPTVKVTTIFDPPRSSNSEIARQLNEGKSLRSVSALRFTRSTDTLVAGMSDGDIYEFNSKTALPPPQLLLHANGWVAELGDASGTLVGAIVNLTANSVGIWDVRRKLQIVSRIDCNTQVDIHNVALGGNLAATTCYNDKTQKHSFDLWKLPSGENAPIPADMRSMNIQSPSVISDDGSLIVTTDGAQRLSVTDLNVGGTHKAMEQSPVHTIDRLEYLSSTHELVVSTGDQAYVWRTTGTTSVNTYTARYGQVAFTDDGVWVAYFDQSHRLRVESRKTKESIETPVVDALVFRVAISSVGPTVFWMNGAGYGGYAKYWRPGESGSHILCQTDIGGEIAVSSLGTFFLIGCNIGTQRFSSAEVLLFRSKDMQLVHSEYGDLINVDSFLPRPVSVAGVFFSRDEKFYGINFGHQIIVGGTDGHEHLKIQNDSEHLKGFLGPIAISDGGHLVSAQELQLPMPAIEGQAPTFQSQNLVLFDSGTGKRISELPIESMAKSLVFAENKLLVGSVDGTVTVHSVPSLSDLATLVHPNGWLAIAPDGFFDGNAEALHWIGWRPKNQRTIVPLDLLYDSYFRPDLLTDVMKSRYTPAKATLATQLGLGSLQVMLDQGYVHTEKSGAQSLLCFSDPPTSSIAVYSDGAPLTFASDQIERGPSLTCPWAAPLPSGAAKIESRLDNPTSISSKAHCPRVQPVTNLPQDRGGVLRLLTIAVGTYSASSSFRALPSAVPSAIAIEKLFSEQPRGEGYLYRDIDVQAGLRDGGIIPTLANIRHSWDEMISRAKPEDTVVVFLAGHGLVPQGTQMFYFAPFDFESTSLATERNTGLNVAMIADMIRNVSARRVVLIIDACQSGAALTSLSKIGEIKAKTQGRLVPGRAFGVYTLASATAFQDAIALPAEGLSPLAEVLVRAQTGEAKGRTTNITVGSIFDKVCRDLPVRARETPLIYAAGDNFAFLTTVH